MNKVAESIVKLQLLQGQFKNVSGPKEWCARFLLHNVIEKSPNGSFCGQSFRISNEKKKRAQNIDVITICH